jgi:hypothetical protein
VYYVYKHSGEPEAFLLEDEALGSGAFDTAEDAARATCHLLPDKQLVMLRGCRSGLIVAIRRPGAREWSAFRGLSWIEASDRERSA